MMIWKRFSAFEKMAGSEVEESKIHFDEVI